MTTKEERAAANLERKLAIAEEVKKEYPDGNILCLDIGSVCGFVVGPASGGHIEECGTMAFQQSHYAADKHAGAIFNRANVFIRGLTVKHKLELVVYEDVVRFLGNSAARKYCGILSIIQRQCFRNNVPMISAHIGQIKKALTGRGNASKELMVSCALDYLNDIGREPPKDMDDNAADAIGLWVWFHDFLLQSGEED